MDGWIRDLVRGGSNKRPFTLPNCSCRALKSHALSVSLTYFLVISRSHEYFSRALFRKATPLFWPLEVLIIVKFLPSLLLNCLDLIN